MAKLSSAGSALVYSTYLGSEPYGSVGNGIAVDSSGNAYVTGYTRSPDFPAVNPIQATCNSCGQSTDAFVTKFNAAGSALVYSTTLGGSSGDGGFGIAVDSSGNAYVTGITTSTDFPTADPFQATCVNCGGNATSDAFVAKLSAAGSALVYSTFLGGSNEDNGLGIAVDSSGSAYVTGQTYSTDFPTVNPIQATCAGCGGGGAYGGEVMYSGYSDAFVAKISPVSLSPTSLSFGAQLVGRSSLKTVTLTNLGSAPLSISGLNVVSFAPSIIPTRTKAEDFTIESGSTCVAGGSVAGPGSCTIDLVFKPAAAGVRSASLVIADSDPSSPQTVNLRGTGTAAPPPATSPGFGPQHADTTSAP